MSKLQLHATTWMSLIHIMLNERSQEQQSTCCMIPSIKLKNRQNYSMVLENRRVVILLGGGAWKGIWETWEAGPVCMLTCMLVTQMYVDCEYSLSCTLRLHVLFSIYGINWLKEKKKAYWIWRHEDDGWAQVLRKCRLRGSNINYNFTNGDSGAESSSGLHLVCKATERFCRDLHPGSRAAEPELYSLHWPGPLSLRAQRHFVFVRIKATLDRRTQSLRLCWEVATCRACGCHFTIVATQTCDQCSWGQPGVM